MDDSTGEVTRLNAAEVNRQAQVFDDGGVPETSTVTGGDVGSRPVDAAAGDRGQGVSGVTAAADGENPLEAEEIEESEHLFPPDIDPTVHLGGSPEEQGALRDEYQRG